MKQICIHCGRKSSSGPIWCQESYCSLNNMVTVFDYGETIGELNIVKPLTVLRSATIYEAERTTEQGLEKVLLKVAHDGHQERLKREAIFLMQLQQNKQFHPMLPTLLPAHTQADITQHPYGKTVFSEQTKYYCIFAHVEGDFLNNMLLKNPQPWYQHAGWIAISLADVIALMHQAQKLHLSLSPESILIRTDKSGTPRPVLMDLGSVSEPANIRQNWNRHYVPPAYIAPEMLGRAGGKVGPATDVYGLGLILHEMLAGRPAYSYRLRPDEDIYRDVLDAEPSRMNRADLKNVPQIANRAISKEYQTRQPDIVSFAQELLAVFPPVPKEPKERRINWRVLGVILGVTLAISLLIAMAVSLAEFAGILAAISLIS